MTSDNRYPVFDGHNDVLFDMYYPESGGGRTFFERSERGHIDLPRAIEGGFGGGFFAVYVPNDPEGRKIPEYQPVYREDGYEAPMVPELEMAYAQSTALSIAGVLFRIERESGGRLKVVRTADELAECLRDGTIAAVFHIEGADPLDTNLNALYVLYEAGLRSVGIVWSRPNAFGHGVPFRFPSSPDTGPGLTDAGKALVRECNSLGIMLDLAHLSERGFWDVAGITDAPLVVTHTAAHALCPSTRNITDKQIDAVGESDGMIGVNFNVRDLRADGRPEPDTPIEEIVRHLDYIAGRIGIDRVGLGSDFDGATVSSHIGDVSGLRKVVAALQEHGYDDAALRKITHENWVRVLRATWKG
ncbi:MAG TPA: dipeptidase [Chloroflexia bacterium]|nr:dipeptidase [Chloroflexia bacterium]